MGDKEKKKRFWNTVRDVALFIVQAIATLKKKK